MTNENDMAARLAALEAELARTKAERDEYKANMYAVLRQLFPEEPLTDAEVEQIRSGQCPPETLSALIAEMKQEIGESPA